jgi:hypothetical protein
VADLDIDFADDDRAGTVTALLAACLADDDGCCLAEDTLWSWSLNQRLQGLLAIRLAAGEAAMELQTRCTHCGEAMELQLDLHSFAGAPVAPRFTWCVDDGAELTLRLPCGRDLQRWARADVHAPQALAAELIEADAGEPTLLDALRLAALEDSFEAHDPLTALRLQAQCPACGQENAIACDLEALLLHDFARMQSRLLDAVVQLARTFHWHEAEIVALPPWRRAHYLRQLDAGDWT